MAECEDPWRARDEILRVVASSLRSRHVAPEQISAALEQYSMHVRIAAIREWTSELLLPFVLSGTLPPVTVIQTVTAAVLTVPRATDVSAQANDIATSQLLERAGVSGVMGFFDPMVSPELADWPVFSEWVAATHHLAIPNPPVASDFLCEAVREVLDSGIVLAMLENDTVRATQLLRWGVFIPCAAPPWYLSLANHLEIFGLSNAQVALCHAIWSRLQL